jgi:hypothetical protein
MLVTRTHVTGPTSSLSLRQDGLRGRFRDQPVDLTWDFQKVSGVYGTRPTLLELSEGDDTRASGTFGGAPVDILVQKNVLLARVGGCAYYMTRVEGGYSGKRDCAGPLEEGFFVNFPESLQTRPVGEMTTLLTLALASYTDTYSPAVSPARFARWQAAMHHQKKASCTRTR